ncbi:hypothetical protein ACFS5N_06915 [Mucilaginibacter ximonensis]|uniref:Lipoprotein n=1 Tax=Mucilaginibacter ximonensis TaxID=538021 RepID=A0ABW5YA66_9SPHI
MKKHYLSILLLLFILGGCKKNSGNQIDNNITPAANGTMHVVVNSDHTFSYNITESNTSTGDFGTKDDYNISKLDYYFTPKPGNTVTIECESDYTSNMTATVTYKGTTLGPITTHGNGSSQGTGFEFTYVVPNN